MSQARKTKTAPTATRLRARAPGGDELVDAPADAGDDLGLPRQERLGQGVDPQWREIANDLAAALRPYSLFGDMVVRDGRIVVQTSVPGATLTAARGALDRLAAQVARESYRRDGLAAEWNNVPTALEDQGERAA